MIILIGLYVDAGIVMRSKFIAAVHQQGHKDGRGTLKHDEKQNTVWHYKDLDKLTKSHNALAQAVNPRGIAAPSLGFTRLLNSFAISIIGTHDTPSCAFTHSMKRS